MFHFSQLKLPIIQAPMAGGINTPSLAAAVANAGGVGSFGFAYSHPQKISEDLIATKALTDGPINANFFIFQPVALPSELIQEQAIDALKNLPGSGKYVVKLPEAPFFPKLEEQLEPIWQHRPAILTFHFGIPPLSVINKAHELGIVVGVTATSLGEAAAIHDAGADFIVAQGVEAGGHRGIFEPGTHDGLLSTLDLIQVLKPICKLPLVAAGGLMQGQDIKKVLESGAVAAQLGTAFLCCDEAGTSAQHRHYLLHEQQRETMFTQAFSGRLARGIKNQFMELMEGKTTLPFPLQNTLTTPLRQFAVSNQDGEYQSLWSGSGFSKIRPISALELMMALKEELSSLA